MKYTNYNGESISAETDHDDGCLLIETANDYVNNHKNDIHEFLRRLKLECGLAGIHGTFED